MKPHSALLVIVLVALPVWALPVHVDFEAPSYVLDSLDGQTGGGIAWSELGPRLDASVARPGFSGAQSARWDVRDLSGPDFADSVGDHMLGLFDNGGASVFHVSAMTFVHLEANRPAGTSRAGHLFVSDDGRQGAAISWLAGGTLGYWGGGTQAIHDTGMPVIYDQWIPVRLDMDYGSDQVTVWYNGSQVAQDTLTGTGRGSAERIEIWLEPVALADNPSPSDWMMIDDIVITPEPASLSVLLLGALALSRRR